MPLDPEQVALFDALQSGKLTRRQFARRLAALGFASSAIAAFLAACGPSAPPASAPAAAPTVPPTALPAVRPTVPVPAAAPTSPPAVAPTAVGTAASASADAGRMASAEPNPKRGGTLRIAFGVTTSNYDLQQGASNSVLTHLYSNLVRLNPVDGLKTIVPDVAGRPRLWSAGLERRQGSTSCGRPSPGRLPPRACARSPRGCPSPPTPSPCETVSSSTMERRSSPTTSSPPITA